MEEVHLSIDQNEFKKLLQSKGLKLTTQRRAVLEIIQKQEGTHLTTEELYEYVKKQCPEIGLATVYRTVQLLEKMNLIRKLNLDDGCSRYEINTNDTDHYHHHLICKNCGKVIEVEEDLLESLEEKIMKNFGFKITNHKLQFYGICKECSLKVNN